MIERKSRNVSLTPELERFVDECLASGRYRSASEVVRAALRHFQDSERPLLQQAPMTEDRPLSRATPGLD